MEEKTFIFFCKVSKKFKTLLFWMGKSGSFGFLSVGFVCREKPNVPLVRWQKNKKMCVGQKLNLCVSSLLALDGVVRYHCLQQLNIIKYIQLSYLKTHVFRVFSYTNAGCRGWEGLF